MVTVVVATAAAAVGACITLLLGLRARSRSNARFDALVHEVDVHLRALAHRLERVVRRVEQARADGVGALELTLGFGELLDRLVSDAAARTGAHAVAARVDGPGSGPVVASFGAEDGAALLGAALGAPASRPFRALTINWTHGPELEGEASAYKSAMVVPIAESGVQTGAVVAYARETGAFLPEHVRALQALADEAAPALTSARRLSDAERRFIADHGTGIRDRKTYEAELEREVARARRTGRPLSLLLLHVGNGDSAARSSASTQRVVPELASLLARVTRATDTLCRPREHEFAILLPETKGSGARRFYSRLRDAVGSAFSHAGPMTFSAGLVEWRPNETSQSLAARAAVAVREGAVDPPELVAPPEPVAIGRPGGPSGSPPDARRAFLDQLAREIDRARADGRPLTLLVLEAEPVAMPEAASGDVETALTDVARRLTDIVERGQSTRIGLDELAAILTGGAVQDAEGVIAALRESLRAQPPRHVERVTLAAGITCLARGDDAGTVVGRAEQALSRAKQAGDGAVVVATASGGPAD